MNRQAQILQALQASPTLDEQRRLVAELNQLRSAAARRVTVAREVELGEHIASAHLTPAPTYVRHTGDTDWLGKVGSRRQAAEIHQAAKAEAGRWYRSTAAIARQDPQEMAIQATGYASLWAGQFDEAASMARQSFLQAAGHHAGLNFLAKEIGYEDDDDYDPADNAPKEDDNDGEMEDDDDYDGPKKESRRHHAERDRATRPKLGDQTACKFCGLDIEYNGGWHDRGGESVCSRYMAGNNGEAKRDQDGVIVPNPNEGKPHQPYSDRTGSRRTAGEYYDDLGPGFTQNSFPQGEKREVARWSTKGGKMTLVVTHGQYGYDYDVFDRQWSSPRSSGSVNASTDAEAIAEIEAQMARGWHDKGLARVSSRRTAANGDTATCATCDGDLEHDGKRWKHSDSENNDHGPLPKNEDGSGRFPVNSVRRTAANTCSVCGDAIESHGDGYHHDNGEKHDHEAKPSKESSLFDGLPPGYMSPEDWDRFYNGDGVSDGVPKDIFPGGGVPLHGDLTPEQQAWMNKGRKKGSRRTAADRCGATTQARIGNQTEMTVTCSKPAGHDGDHQGVTLDSDDNAIMYRFSSRRTAASPDFSSYPKNRAPGQEWSTTCSVCGKTETGTDYYNGWPSQKAFGDHLFCGHDPSLDYHQDLAIDRYSSRRTATDGPSENSQNGYAESGLDQIESGDDPANTNMGWISEGDSDADNDRNGSDALITAGIQFGPFEAAFMGVTATTRTAAQEGWWPMGPSKNFPGEQTPVCPSCGSPDISISGNNLGRDIVNNNLYTSLTCNSCGRRDILPEKPKDLRGASRKQAGDLPRPSEMSQNGYGESSLDQIEATDPDALLDTNLGWIADGDANADPSDSFDREASRRTAGWEAWESLAPGTPIRIGFEESARNGTFVRIEPDGSWTKDGRPVVVYLDDAGIERTYTPTGSDMTGNYEQPRPARVASRRKAAESNDRPAGAAPMVDHTSDDPGYDHDMFGGEWVYDGEFGDGQPNSGDSSFEKKPSINETPINATGSLDDFDLWSELPQKTAMPAPADHNIEIGDIFYCSWGYDQTNIDFYEVVGLTPAGMKVRPIGKKFVSQGGAGGNKVVAVPGSFTGESMTKRLQLTTWREPAEPTFSVNSYSSAYLWDGTPMYETDSQFGH